ALAFWGLPLAAVSTLAGGPFWVKMGLFFTQAALLTFGGAYAVLPYVADRAVEEFHWLSPAQMLDALALGETTPGPLVMVLAFVGFLAAWGQMGHSLMAGVAGLLLTTYYTFLPGFFFILGGAPLIEHTKGHQGLQSVLTMITAAVTGVLLSLALYLARGVLFPGGLSIEGLSLLSALWSLVSWLALYRFKISVPLWVGISALAGLCAHAAGQSF
ncbi:MAG: chromate transporter, partial [Bacteroidetes bacterium]